MRWTEQVQGLRLMKFEEVYRRTHRGGLSQAEAAEVLGVSERTFRRWRDRYEAEGADGLYDRRLGRVSARIVVAATTWRCCVVGSGHVFTLGGWRAQVPKDRSDIAPGLGCRFDARLGYLDRFVSVLAMALDKSTGVDGQRIVPAFPK